MEWPDDIPFDPNRKRYYFVSEDLHRNPSDFERLNEDDLYLKTEPSEDGNSYPITTGLHSYTLPGRTHATSYGLPQLLQKPKIFVARRNKPLDIYGFHQDRLISTRAKDLLCETDPAAFEFVECDTVSRKNVTVESYWMVRNVRPVHSFDEKRSTFELASGLDGFTGEPYNGPHFSAMFDIHMSSDFDENSHAFFFTRFTSHMVFDEILVDEWRRRKYTGAEFLPLQPPTPKERTERAYFGNFQYWRKGWFREGRTRQVLV